MRFSLLLAAGVIVATAAAACHHTSSEPPPPATTEASPPPAPVHVAAVLPPRPAVAYVGSERCKECHAKEHAAWSRDWHHRALSPATSANVVGDFGGAHFKGTSSEAWMRKDGARRVMRTAGEKGEIADYSVDWVIGGKRMQDTVHVFPDGRWQVMPVYFHVGLETGPGTASWVDYTEAKQGALTPEHPFYWTNFRRTANRECLDCHSTGMKVSYARPTHAWTTSFADASVGCESCHGPGATHAASSDPTDIFQPKEGTRAQKTALCAQCHGPRNPLFPILDHDDHFRPGEAYDDSYDPVVVLLGDGRSGDYFADGRPKTSSFEYQAMIQSRCYLKSDSLTCLTCHGPPHGPRTKDELRVAGDAGVPSDAELADASCKTCHAEVVTQGRAHTNHANVRCVGCHMPSTVTGVLDHFADHAIDVPNPTTTEAHGVPNACGVCHADKSPKELEAWLLSKWPDAAKRQARRTRLADAFDPANDGKNRDALRGVASDDAEAPTLRGAALLLLAKHFPAEVRAVAVPLLDHADPVLRTKAATALGTARVKDAKEALAAHVGDASLPVAEAVAIALASFGDARGNEALRTLADGPRTSHLLQPQLAVGIAKARAGDVAGAVPYFRRAVDLAPYSADALVMLSDALVRTGHEMEAPPLLEDALRFEPDHRAAQARLEGLRGR